MSSDRREIYPLLLNAYLARLSVQEGDGEEDGRPLCEALLHEKDGEELLILRCKHFRLDFPPTAHGMLAARRAIDELVKLARGSDLRLGDALELDPERGYYMPLEAGDG